jgi:hypothetical protein
LISRVTLFSFLLALLLASGIRLWYIGQRDECARFLAGDKRFPASQVVVEGTRSVVVPCTQWLPRQPLEVQTLCLLDLVLVVVFAMNGLADARDSLVRWRRLRRSATSGAGRDSTP